MNLLQCKHHTGKGCVKCCSQSCRSPAGQKQTLFHLYTVKQLCNRFSCHRSQLYAGAFPSQRQTAEGTQRSANHLRRQHTRPLLVDKGHDFSFHLRNSATGDQRLRLQELRNQKSQYEQKSKPQHDMRPVGADKCNRSRNKILRVAQNDAIQHGNQTGTKTGRKPFPNQYVFKISCTMQNMKRTSMFSLFHKSHPSFSKIIAFVSPFYKSLPVATRFLYSRSRSAVTPFSLYRCNLRVNALL